MMYAPRAIRHFSLAAAEARGHRTAEPVPASPRPVEGEPVVANQRFVLRLWLPLTAIFLLLAPFALLLAPLFYFAPRPYGERPFASALVIGRVLLNLGGTRVEVDTAEALVRIRIF